MYLEMCMAVQLNVPLSRLSFSGSIKQSNMRGLDLKNHTESTVSIKDTTHSIDLSESKWDPLFKFLLDVNENVYFMV